MAQQIASFIGWVMGQSSYNVSSVDGYVYMTCCVLVVMLVFFMFSIISDIVYRVTKRR